MNDAISRSTVVKALESEKGRLMGGKGCDWPFTGEILATALDAVLEYIKSIPTVSLNTLRDAIYEDAVAHGLWEETDEFGAEDPEEPDETKRKADADFCKQYDAVQKLLFEADEALCAVEDRNWENVQEEIADVVIQAFSTAGYLGIDIDAAIRRKMEINKKRPWKHGEE